jgi:hypothetical protein
MMISSMRRIMGIDTAYGLAHIGSGSWSSNPWGSNPWYKTSRGFVAGSFTDTLVIRPAVQGTIVPRFLVSPSGLY